MVLIDLSLIGDLALEGESQKFTVTSYCYNADVKRKYQMSDTLFVGLYKMYVQSDNLFTHLQKLHQVCFDFAAGNLQPYVVEYESYRNGTPDEEHSVYNPFDELIFCFGSNTVSDLPAKIEQYGELMLAASKFSTVQATKREGFKKYFGKVNGGYMIDGQIVPEDQLPNQLVNELKVNEEIREVNVEFCLDKYNEFYATCSNLIKQHETTGNYQTCASETLKLFAPYKVHLTQVSSQN